MNSKLAEIIKSIDGIKIKASTDDLPKILIDIASTKANLDALAEFTINKIAELKNEEVDKLHDEFEEILAVSLADKFTQFLSGSDRMT